MDDPWANAWGESSKPPLPILETASSTWAAPSVSVIHGDNEDDLSASSWSIQPTTSHWNGPGISDTLLWNNDMSSAWNPTPSTFDNISLSKASEHDTHTSVALSKEPSPPSSPLSRDEDPHSPSPPVKPPDATPPPSPAPSELSLPGPVDIDAFGTFEAGEGIDSAAWSPSETKDPLPSVWGPSWEDPDSVPTSAATRTDTEPDIWEKARQEKEKQDRHVPPEFLASILHHFEELSNDIWPDSEATSTNPLHAERSLNPDDLGLNHVMLRLIPQDLTLPANVPCSKTFIAKQLSEALRLTRHTPPTKHSPMAFYMSSKGLTSWEASLKAKPNVTSDDVTPAGWKLVGSEKGDVPVNEEAKKKPNGGLFSFFGRKSTSSDAPGMSRSASPVSAPGPSSVKVGSPRPSSDSTQPASARNQVAGQTMPSSPSFAGILEIPSHKKSSSLSNNVAAPEAVVPDIIQRQATPPPLTAVSRFLGRFSSRPRSSSRDSLALSADDFEFLSDVPTVGTKEDKNTELDALSFMLNSSSLSTSLPPPLKPPPRAPPHTSSTSSVITSMQGGAELDTQDDFLSLLDSGPVPRLPSLTTVVPTSHVKTAMTPTASSGGPSNSVNSFNNPTPASAPSYQINEVQDGQSWATFDYPSTPMKKSTQTKRPFVAIMSSPSSRTSSTPPPLLPKPTTASFLLPSPPSDLKMSNGTSRITGSGNIISPLPPPPPSRAEMPSRNFPQYQPPPPPPTGIDDDDEFSDFLSSPSQTTNPVQLSFGDFPPPTMSSNSLASQPAASSNSLDAFDAFVNSPSPPQPPAKPLNFSANFYGTENLASKALKDSPVSREQSNSPRRTSRVADHSRTLSLLETAAARGRWLAPPSPLPEALPPPNTSNGQNTDFLDSGSSMQSQQARATISLAASSSASAIASKAPAWNFPPPLNPSLFDSNPDPRSTLSAPANKPLPLMLPSARPSNSVTSTGSKTGGLSAQDLSFFEGF